MTFTTYKSGIIYNEDCFKLFDKLKDKTIDHIFTSPPYNRKRNDKYSFYDDTINNYYEFLSRFIEQGLRVVNKFLFINIQTNYYNASDVYKIIGTYSDYIKQIIVWNKTNPMPANGYNITNSYELFLVISKDMESLKSNKTYTKNLISTSVNSKMPKTHKAVMKYDVAEWFIQMFTKPRELIFDPFMGIGTTALVCEKNNRRYIGAEISNEYCEMIKETLSNYRKDV